MTAILHVGVTAFGAIVLGLLALYAIGEVLIFSLEKVLKAFRIYKLFVRFMWDRAKQERLAPGKMKGASNDD